MASANRPVRICLTFEHLESDFQVLSFKGEEALNQPYRFEVSVVSEHAALDLESLLHQSAFLAFDEHGNGVHGQVLQVAQTESGRRLHHYRIVLVPRLSYLAYRTNQRIFQHKSVAQIITLLLQDHAVPADAFAFALGSPGAPREFCVQYDESDLHFLQRLCEEEGIHYHFEHSRQGHRLVFGDDQTCFPRRAAPIAYAQHRGLQAEASVIDRFAMRLEARTNRVTRRDYAFEHPRLLLEAGASLQPWPGAEPLLEDYDYPGRFSDRTQGRQQSQRALERHRADYRQVSGHSDVAGLACGQFFTLTGHPHTEWNALWLLTEVHHEGHQPQVLEESMPAGDGEAGYRNEFLAAPWDAVYRPPLRHPKPRVLGYQSAVVTGPAGEEIHCDRHGRVKVQFFWDREGQGDDSSSCWLRVASGWAGERIGGLSIPRVGMEVLVEFLEGDPDQPVVAGCLFHGEHLPPHALPAYRTRSVLRTRSSPGGGGFNEVHVEDKAGQEQLFMHAQRDWDQSIGRDQKIRVGRQRHECVQANSYSQFQAEEHRTILGDRKTEIQGGDHLRVGDNQHLKVGRAHLLEAGREIHVKAGQHLVIEAGQELTVQAGGSFIRLDAQGLLLAGSEVEVNGAGTSGRGSGVALLRPVLPKPVAAGRPGHALAAQSAPAAPRAEPAAPQYCLDIRLNDVPGDTGFPLANTRWQIHEDGQNTPLLEGISDAAGQVQLDAPQRQRLVAAASSLWLCYCGQRLPMLLEGEPADAQRQRFALSALDFHDCLGHPRADAASQARADQELAETGDLYGQLHDGEA